ncbi:MAG: hypothetical protein BWY06_03399 [Candidatus Latescibacteria bacterium ADurb.Bin168]|nr:MAG: hypothetical protein BWY06_03399 [Candidatus Latescibacteria bacterium ADurb.Bin168]
MLPLILDKLQSEILPEVIPGNIPETFQSDDGDVRHETCAVREAVGDGLRQVARGTAHSFVEPFPVGECAGSVALVACEFEEGREGDQGPARNPGGHPVGIQVRAVGLRPAEKMLSQGESVFPRVFKSCEEMVGDQSFHPFMARIYSIPGWPDMVCEMDGLAALVDRVRWIRVDGIHIHHVPYVGFRGLQPYLSVAGSQELQHCHVRHVVLVVDPDHLLHGILTFQMPSPALRAVPDSVRVAIMEHSVGARQTAEPSGKMRFKLRVGFSPCCKEEGYGVGFLDVVRVHSGNHRAEYGCDRRHRGFVIFGGVRKRQEQLVCFRHPAAKIPHARSIRPDVVPQRAAVIMDGFREEEMAPPG